MAHRNRRGIERVDLQRVQTGDRCDNVDDCIHRANFVEMNATGGCTMNFGLRLGQACEDAGCAISHPGCKRRGVEHGDDIAEASLRPSLLGQYIDPRCAKRAFHHLLDLHRPFFIGDSQRFDRLPDLRRVEAAIDQAAEHHVAGES